MSISDDDPQFTRRLRMLQIMYGAQGLGPACFIVIAYVLRATRFNGQPANGVVITYVAAAVGAMGLLISFYVPAFVTRAMRGSAQRYTGSMTARTAVPRLNADWQTYFIFKTVIPSGAAFFCSIAYLVEGQLVTLGLAVILVIAILVRFPTRGVIDRWTEKQSPPLDQEAQTMT
jgi:hypothetical protein